MHVVSLFESNARKYADKPFMRYLGCDYTYAEANELSQRGAAVFASLGIASGDRVAIMCFNTPGFVIAMLAAWRLGATVVPINHKMQAPEVDYILTHAGAKLCVADGALAPVVARLTTRVGLLSTDSALPGHASFDELVRVVSPLRGIALDENAVAELLYTSGTTGRPKGCVMTHRAVCMAALTAALAFSMTRNERTLLAMPLWHSSPLNNWMLGTLYVGGTVVLMREYHPGTFLPIVQEERITFYFGAPVSFLMPMQLGCKIEEYDLSSVRVWVYGGGPIGVEVAQQLARAYRSEQFYQAFGMTETGPAGTVLYPEEQVAKAGSIGRVATPGVDVRVVREDGTEVQPGEIGEIWLKAESLMSGYLDNAAATADAFRDGWYRSGDLARVDEDGFLYVVDRLKDMIVTGGENVYSKEVEDALLAHPGIRDAAVIGRPHPEWGETVVAFVVPDDSAPLDAEEIKAFLATRLARYKIPREYITQATLPRTPTGKLIKHLLRSPVEGAEH